MYFVHSFLAAATAGLFVSVNAWKQMVNDEVVTVVQTNTHYVCPCETNIFTTSSAAGAIEWFDWDGSGADVSHSFGWSGRPTSLHATTPISDLTTTRGHHSHPTSGSVEVSSVTRSLSGGHGHGTEPSSSWSSSHSSGSHSTHHPSGTSTTSSVTTTSTTSRYHHHTTSSSSSSGTSTTSTTSSSTTETTTSTSTTSSTSTTTTSSTSSSTTTSSISPSTTSTTSTSTTSSTSSPTTSSSSSTTSTSTTSSTTSTTSTSPPLTTTTSSSTSPPFTIPTTTPSPTTTSSTLSTTTTSSTTTTTPPPSTTTATTTTTTTTTTPNCDGLAAGPTPGPVTGCTFNILCSTLLTGALLLGATGASDAETCLTVCDEQGPCGGWDFDTVSNVCTLYLNVGAEPILEDNPTHVAGQLISC
ncbi:hypothetical protein AYL99_11218 [Fonsecaea erecta]|uniref:Apple domain-containing protein n=1 Tax=Fonsecaea erecta TaxID=1367422 RepID=A0A178Z4T2_9EURO|nr:hypothetical protein AYL99_11218 [Fonsecaea erecta]OAP54770.1 hypothetical protein AYL99_11218 [Fonsecaea erecta]